MPDSIESLLQDPAWKARLKSARAAGASWDQIRSSLTRQGILRTAELPSTEPQRTTTVTTFEPPVSPEAPNAPSMTPGQPAPVGPAPSLGGLEEYLPDARTVTGMVGSALGAEAGGPFGAAAGYPIGAQAYDLYRHVRDPSAESGGMSQAVEDVLVGGLSTAWGEGIKLMGGRAVQTRLGKAVLQRALGTERLQAAKAGQSAIGQLWVKGKEAAGGHFDQIAEAAGESGPHLTSFGQEMEQIANERHVGGIPRPAGRAADLMLPEGEGRQVGGRLVGHQRGGRIVKVLQQAIGTGDEADVDTAVAIGNRLFHMGFTEHEINDLALYAPDALRMFGAKAEVPFGLVRRAQTELSAAGGTRLVAGPRQALFRRLAGALDQDIDAWLEQTDVTVEGQPAKAALATAKENYRNFRRDYGLAVQRMLGQGKIVGKGELLAPERGVLPEQALENAFTPGTPTVTKTLQQILPQETYRDLVFAWLDRIYQGAYEENAPGSMARSQRQFARRLAAFVPDGHLDLILEPLVKSGELPGGAETLLQAARPTTMTRAGESLRFGPHGTLRALIGGAALGGSEPVMKYFSGMPGYQFHMGPDEIISTGLGGILSSVLRDPMGAGLQRAGQQVPIGNLLAQALSQVPPGAQRAVLQAVAADLEKALSPRQTE